MIGVDGIVVVSPKRSPSLPTAFSMIFDVPNTCPILRGFFIFS